jgi:hypothetical protein
MQTARVPSNRALLGARDFVQDRLRGLHVAFHPLALALALTPVLACGGDDAPPPGSGAGGRRTPDAQDGGTRSPPAVSLRPDGGAILPPADEEIALPFRGPAVLRTLEIAAAPRVLDLHISVDTTASMHGEIDELQRSLRTQVMPMLRAEVPDVSFGASRFEDFAIPPFGNPSVQGRDDEPFVLLSPITSDEERVANAIAGLDQPLGLGGDLPESGFEALFQIATGEGYGFAGVPVIARYTRRAEVGGGTLGGVGFREGALRAVLHVTDAPSHTPADYADTFPGTHDLQDAAGALFAINAKLIAIVSSCTAKAGRCDLEAYATARAQLEQLATRTGAVGPAIDGGCPYGAEGRVLPATDDGCPLVFDVMPDGSGLPSTLIDSVAALLDGTRFRVVSALAADDPIGFVQRIEPIEPVLEPGQSAPEIADLFPESEPDGEPDSFVTVAARTAVAFELELRNLAIAESESEQRFRIVIEVRGDDLVLERRTLRILIPKGDRLSPPPDAGTDADAGAENSAP